MKWKGRRESSNLEDGRGEAMDVTIEDLINDDFIPNGPMQTKPKSRKEGVDEFLKKKPWRKAAKEILDHDRKGTIPTPTPKPKHNKDTNTNKVQVTPGSWKTVNK